MNKQEKKRIKEAISLCKNYNFWDLTSMRFTLGNVKNFLEDNFEESVQLFENLLANAVANDDALHNLKADVLKKREDAKLNKQTILYKPVFSFVCC